MVEIEPYGFQKKTNIKEHNDLVAKINEIVDVINNTNMETVIPRISKLETDVSELTDNDNVQNNDISSLKTKTAKLETDVSGLTDNDSVQDTDISSLKTKTAKLETDVSAINNTDSLQWQDIESVKGDIGTITPKITKLEQDVTDINSTDATQNTDISNLKTKDSEHDTRLGTIDTEINGINKTLVSDVAILNGTTIGNMKVRIGRKDAPSIDSNDYNIQKPTSVELIQGSAPAMVKAQITLSDGTVLISDDFMFTTEAIGQDVYISSFVFKNGNVAGTISADIGLSNGSTLTANNFVVPTDPNVTSAIGDIQGKLTTVENDVADLKIDKADANNSNQSIVAGSISATNITKGGVDVATVNDISGKADLNNSSQTIIAGTINATNINKNGVAVATINDIPNISGKVDKAQGTQNAGKVLGINSSGNVEPITVSGGEEWEEVDLKNLPTDWSTKDKIRLATTILCTSSGTIDANYEWSSVMQFDFYDQNHTPKRTIYSMNNSAIYSVVISSPSAFNDASSAVSIFTFYYTPRSSGNSVYVSIKKRELSAYLNSIKMYRLKK